MQPRITMKEKDNNYALITRSDRVVVGRGGQISLPLEQGASALGRYYSRGYYYADIMHSTTENVVLASNEDNTIRDALLEGGVVCVVSLKDWWRYLTSLQKCIRRSTRRSPETRSENMVDDLKSWALGSSGILAAQGGWLNALSTTKDDAAGVVYFAGAPPIMVEAWLRLTNKAPLKLYIDVDENEPFSIDLGAGDIQCDRYESLVDLGCIACPHSSACVSSLLNQDLTLERPVDMHKAMRRYSGTLVPPSVAKDGSVPYSSKMLHVSKLDMRGISGNYIRHMAKKEARKTRAKFYKDNCESCVLTSVCGSSKAIISHSGEGVESFCSGKPASTKVVITDDNWEGLAKILLLTSLCLNQRSKAPDLASEEHLSRVETYLDYCRSWVNGHGSMPRAVSKLSASRYRIAVPKVLVRISTDIGYTGPYGEGYVYWYDLNRGWVQDLSEEMASVVGSRLRPSGWCILGLPGEFGYSRAALAVSVDARLLADIEQVSWQGYSTTYKSKASRINLLYRYLRYALAPSTIHYHGPFASRKSYVMSPYSLTSAEPGKDSGELWLEALESMLDAYSHNMGEHHIKLATQWLNNLMKEEIE